MPQHAYKQASKMVDITQHAKERIAEKIGITGDVSKVISTIWDRQMGPDPAWKVPRIRKRGVPYRYLSHKNFVFVFRVVDRSHLGKGRRPVLITVVGPLSENKPWKSSYDECG